MIDFINKTAKFQELYKNFPQRAGSLAVKFSKERFVRKNWVDRKPEKWAKRKREDRGSLMIRTGRLKRSIRKIKVTRNFVIIGTDVPYAQPLNDGAKLSKTVTVRSHTRKRQGRKETVKSHKRKMNTTLKPRPFIGESAILLRRIERMVQKDIQKILNS